ncbi:MAG: glycosyltransferase family 2 protein [Flavobacteriaceae bacterium]|nr:glycosyltransferase family 2 protein [Flavobacteriaceae bacterium]
MKVSGLIITYNEGNNIGKCIKTLFKICDEVIIIDSNSTDNTCEIATELGAKVYSQKFLGDGPQRIYGLQFCKNDWILNPDADEIFEDDALTFFEKGSYFKDSYDGYRFKRINYIGKSHATSTPLSIDYTCRFFNKKTASPSTYSVHQQVTGENLTKINVTLHHYAYLDYHQLIAKVNQYTDWQATEYLEKNRNISFLTPFAHSFFSFIKFYFIKKGFLFKLDGITYSIVQSFFTYIKYAKYIHLKNNASKK